MANKNTTYFPAYYKDIPGAWWFTPNEGFFKEGVPSYGDGAIKYGEGSVYFGEIYYDGANFFKQGYGFQDFSRSSIGVYNPQNRLKTWRFYGYFDYKETNWIFGNGVLYFTDGHNRPKAFMKGFFRGLSKFREYEGEFDYSTLIDGFTKDMETEVNSSHLYVFKRELRSFNRITNFQNLFVGDSYFEFMYYPQYSGSGNLFGDNFDTKKNLNIGVGGSTFDEWFDYIPMIKFNKQPKNIFINLGFNDINDHIFATEKDVYQNYLTLLKMLREKFPKSKYYLFDSAYVAPIVSDKNRVDLHKKWHELIYKSAKENNVTILPLNETFANSKVIWYDKDRVHPNKDGYTLFYKLIKDTIENK